MINLLEIKTLDQLFFYKPWKYNYVLQRKKNVTYLGKKLLKAVLFYWNMKIITVFPISNQNIFNVSILQSEWSCSANYPGQHSSLLFYHWTSALLLKFAQMQIHVFLRNSSQKPSISSSAFHYLFESYSGTFTILIWHHPCCVIFAFLPSLLPLFLFSFLLHYSLFPSNAFLIL